MILHRCEWIVMVIKIVLICLMCPCYGHSWILRYNINVPQNTWRIEVMVTFVEETLNQLHQISKEFYFQELPPKEVNKIVENLILKAEVNMFEPVGEQNSFVFELEYPKSMNFYAIFEHAINVMYDKLKTQVDLKRPLEQIIWGKLDEFLDQFLGKMKTTMLTPNIARDIEMFYLQSVRLYNYVYAISNNPVQESQKIKEKMEQTRQLLYDKAYDLRVPCLIKSFHWKLYEAYYELKDSTEALGKSYFSKDTNRYIEELIIMVKEARNSASDINNAKSILKQADKKLERLLLVSPSTCIKLLPSLETANMEFQHLDINSRLSAISQRMVDRCSKTTVNQNDIARILKHLDQTLLHILEKITNQEENSSPQDLLQKMLKLNERLSASAKSNVLLAFSITASLDKELVRDFDHELLALVPSTINAAISYLNQSSNDVGLLPVDEYQNELKNYLYLLEYYYAKSREEYLQLATTAKHLLLNDKKDKNTYSNTIDWEVTVNKTTALVKLVSEGSTTVGKQFIPEVYEELDKIDFSNKKDMRPCELCQDLIKVLKLFINYKDFNIIYQEGLESISTILECITFNHSEPFGCTLTNTGNQQIAFTFQTTAEADHLAVLIYEYLISLLKVQLSLIFAEISYTRSTVMFDKPRDSEIQNSSEKIPESRVGSRGPFSSSNINSLEDSFYFPSKYDRDTVHTVLSSLISDVNWKGVLKEVIAYSKTASTEEIDEITYRNRMLEILSKIKTISITSPLPYDRSLISAVLHLNAHSAFTLVQPLVVITLNSLKQCAQKKFEVYCKTDNFPGNYVYRFKKDDPILYDLELSRMMLALLKLQLHLTLAESNADYNSLTRFINLEQLI